MLASSTTWSHLHARSPCVFHEFRIAGESPPAPSNFATTPQNHAIVCIEDFQVRNKSKSAPVSIEDPEKNVRAKVGLNQSVFHQGWFKADRPQAELERRISDCRSCARHEPMLPQVRALREEARKTQAKFGCVNCK